MNHRSLGTAPKRLLSARLAFLTMTAMIALPATGNAQFYWPDRHFQLDSDDDSAAPPPVAPQPRVKRSHTVRRQIAKTDSIIKETTKPQGPLLIAVSIQDQELKIYDNNGLFAQTPVSTGMRGHSTPMGAFSILAKEKYHRSNIYSNAPMPYMQRITWSGVAMHAGVLPGYPASHGCIRMPMNFAIRMYGWTRTGARVVIAPDGLAPADFSHPLLFTRRPDLPQAAALPAPETVAQAGPAPAQKSDKETAATAETRATAGSAVHTADASGAIPSLTNDPVLKTSKDQGRPDDPAAVATTDNKAAEPAPSATKPADGNSATTGSAETKPDDKAKADTPDAAKSAKAEPVAPKRSGHIAAFISRKEGKLFVRQNFEPLFEAPVTIADGGPLGTHIFTMRIEKTDPKTFQWSVVSLPQSSRAETVSTRRKKPDNDNIATTVATSPADALDRIKIPDEAMQKLAETFGSGDSLIVSDLGLGNETGLGTDFIVPVR